MKFSIVKSLLALALLFTFNACVFEDFDEPPVGNLSDLEGNISVAELKALHTLGEDPSVIEGADLVLEGFIVGNDETGSIFKELYIQDETGGIVVRVDEVGLNGLYPIGSTVVMPLSGLYIGDFNNKYQITVVGGDRIPAALVRSTIFIAADPVDVAPTLITLSELTDQETFERYLSTLVVFEDLQFNGGDAGVPFADVAASQDLNRTFVDCDGNQLVTRTSSFADFAGENTPAGKGRVIGLLDVFGDTRQIKLRKLADLVMNGERCGTVTGSNLISLAELRAQYTGTTTAISDDTKIRGIVISDLNSGVQQPQNLVLQDGGSGIVIRFDQAHNFALGTDLEIAVSGQELSEFRTLLQVNNLSLDNATSQGVISLPTPRQATVAELLANGEAWESTLVEIDPATVTGGPTFGAGLNVTDASGGNIEIFSLFANFADETAPTGEGIVTAILSEFDDNFQLLLNSTSGVDVDGGVMPGDEEEITASELRDLFISGASSVPADRFIEGIVVSDVFSGNFNEQNLVLQTGESGIVIRFSEAYSIPQDNRVRISIGGQELSEFRTLLQVNNVPLTGVTDFGADEAPEPRETTIADVLANGEAWESTVVQIENVSIDVANFPANGSITLNDGTGELTGFIRETAAFAGQAVPAGPLTITVVVTEFDGAFQVLVRNLEDFE